MSEYCEITIENGRQFRTEAYPNDCTWVDVLGADLEAERIPLEVRSLGEVASLEEMRATLIRIAQAGGAELKEIESWFPDGQLAEYGLEYVLIAESGHIACLDPTGTYARVVVDGKEIAYWAEGEFVEDPSLVFGAFFGALHGQ